MARLLRAITRDVTLLASIAGLFLVLVPICFAQDPLARFLTDTTVKITKPGDYFYAVEYRGATRLYMIRVPARYDATAPAPLLLALHSSGGNMFYMANDASYGLNAKAEREGFVLVYPNGTSETKDGKVATWNAGRCCGHARKIGSDDVGFIREVVRIVKRQLNIDGERIYATGMSTGGSMVYRLACEMSDVLRAVSSVAGTDNTVTCKPGRPVSVLHIHARNDKYVLYDGGAGPDAIKAGEKSDFVAVGATIAKWTKRNGCPAKPERILEKPGASCDLYSPCRGGSQVELCTTETGGHSWPGGHWPIRFEQPSKAISANDVMWEFFERR